MRSTALRIIASPMPVPEKPECSTSLRFDMSEMSFAGLIQEASVFLREDVPITAHGAQRRAQIVSDGVAWAFEGFYRLLQVSGTLVHPQLEALSVHAQLFPGLMQGVFGAAPFSNNRGEYDCSQGNGAHER